MSPNLSLKMTFSIEMEPSLNLGSVPPDVKRMILEMEQDSACQARLVSKSDQFSSVSSHFGLLTEPFPFENSYRLLSGPKKEVPSAPIDNARVVMTIITDL